MARSLLALALLSAAALPAAAAGAPADDGRIGPVNQIQPTGRLLQPAGKMTQLGNFPVGGALTSNGRYLWTLSGGRGHNDIRIVAVDPPLVPCRKPRGKRKTRKSRRRAAKRYSRCLAKHRKQRDAKVGSVIQTIEMPGLSGGIAMSADGTTAYVSGLADSGHKDQQVPDSVPGRKGDTVHVFRLDPDGGSARRDGTIDVPVPGSAPFIQTFPPGTSKTSYPRDLAISPDGKTLLVALNLADAAAVVDVDSKRVRYVTTGTYPYGAAITANGRYGLVSSEGSGAVSVIDLSSGAKVKDIQVGAHLSHPESIAVDPLAERAYVAVTHEDRIAVIDTGGLKVERYLSVERPDGNGTTPTMVSVTPDACRLLVADSGEDAIAVFSLPRDCPVTAPAKAKKKKSKRSKKKRKKKRKKAKPAPGFDAKPYELVGRIPVGSYPTAVAASGATGKLAWVSARGVGVGPNVNGPNPLSPDDSDDKINSFQYLPSFVTGSSGVLGFPKDAEVRALNARATTQITPVNTQQAPAGSPIAPPGPSAKIKHVFYVVRENRTYDQVLGDDPRGDGDPKLTLFGEQNTPNLHALARRFPLLDHVYANSEASIDGHFWTSAGAVSDYVTKNWHQNYGDRNKRPYDFGAYTITFPPKGFIFDGLEKQGIPWFNYGEALVGLSPLPDKDRTDAQTQAAAVKLTKSDIQLNAGCYDSDVSNSTVLSQGQIDVYDSSVPAGGKPGSHSRFDCFQARFLSQLATSSVPAFNYLVLPNDHTEGTTPDRRTPQAQIASNDLGLGQIVDTISHSSVWQDSLILVMEDDSQDGADHVDAHRIPALAISPYAKRGAVVHTRYDLLSMFRTAELAVGMKPLGLFDTLATPMYDAFDSDPSNNEPYGVIQPGVDITARNTANSANARESAALPLNNPDQVPQRTLDRLLWQSVHGTGSTPPPPGPNASGEDEEGAEAPAG